MPEKAFSVCIKDSVFIDPPYNTGNDFVYADNFADPIARYKEVTQQTTKSNPETMGRFHTNWLNMMYPRLRLAANLLRDDGVIFISIDDNEVTNLRKICDEVFGEENFICQFVWKSKLGKVGTTSTISCTHEYILCYAKEIAKVSFKMIESGNEGRRENLRQWGQADRREDRPSMYYPICINGIEVYPIKEDGTEGRWRVGKEMAEQLLEKGLLELVEKNGNYQIYRNFEASTSIIPHETLLLDDIGTTAKGAFALKSLDMNKAFDYSKPIDLVKHFIMLCTSSDELILDFFSGSATTAHAVMQLNAEDGGNRKFICVQIPELCDEKSEAYKAGYKNICEIGKERIRRAGKSILDRQCTAIFLEAGLDLLQTQLDMENTADVDHEMDVYDKLDVGFKVFKLDTSNLKTWDNTLVAEDDMQILLDRMNGMIHRVKSDRSDMDMVCEIMLKLGVPLDCSVEKIEFNGKTAYTVGKDCLLLVCLAEDVQPEDVETMAEYAPAKVIIARDSFADDTVMSNAHYILRDRGIELKLV